MSLLNWKPEIKHFLRLYNHFTQAFNYTFNVSGNVMTKWPPQMLLENKIDVALILRCTVITNSESQNRAFNCVENKQASGVGHCPGPSECGQYRGCPCLLPIEQMCPSLGPGLPTVCLHPQPRPPYAHPADTDFGTPWPQCTIRQTDSFRMRACVRSVMYINRLYA